MCLHDDRVKSLVDAPPLRQGEEAARTLVGASLGVLVPLGADLRRGLGLDQFLHDLLGDAASGAPHRCLRMTPSPLVASEGVTQRDLTI